MQPSHPFLSALHLWFRRRQAQRMLRTHCDDEAKKLLAMKIGQPPNDRTTVLQADTSLPATILASDVRYDDALKPVLAAQFTLLERGRVAEAETLRPLEEQYADRVAQFSAVQNACALPAGVTPDRPGLEASLDTLKNDLAQLRRRARSFLWRAGGMGTLGALLFAGDLVLIYQNFALLLSNQNTDALTLSFTSIVSTLLVVLLLLVLTHLGLAPLFHDALETVRRNKAGFLDSSLETPELPDVPEMPQMPPEMPDVPRMPPEMPGVPQILEVPKKGKEEHQWKEWKEWQDRSRHYFFTHLLSVVSCALTLLVSFLIAWMRKILVVDDDSGGVFVALGTLGLPILSLFIHLCFTAAHALWVQYRAQKDAFLDAVQPVREVDQALGRLEKQRRRALPISRDLQRLEMKFEREAGAAYRRVANHTGTKSAVRRLAEQLVPSAPPASPAAPDTAHPQTGETS